LREWIVGLMLAVGMATAAAQDMQTPRISRPKVDWDAAAADLKDIEEPGVVQSDGPPPAGAAFASLNQATSDFFSNIAASPVPVLLPFDTAAFLRDRAAATPNKSVGDYLSGFHPSPFFLTGPAGYDVVFYA
jgi:hypothetical protein